MNADRRRGIGVNQRGHQRPSAFQSAVGCALALLLFAPVWAAELKLGYVNAARLFDSYQRTKESEQALEAKGQQKETELRGRAEQLKKLRESLELLNAQAREPKLREIEEKSDEFQRLKTRTERELVRERNRVAKLILDEVEQVVSEYAKANGYVLILDQRSLLYGEDAADVTDSILRILNERFAARAAKPGKP